MKPALAICKSCEGSWDENAAKAVSGDEPSEQSVSQWKNSFLKAPYLRDALVRRGYITETFEVRVNGPLKETLTEI